MSEPKFDLIDRTAARIGDAQVTTGTGTILGPDRVVAHRSIIRQPLNNPFVVFRSDEAREATRIQDGLPADLFLLRVPPFPLPEDPPETGPLAPGRSALVKAFARPGGTPRRIELTVAKQTGAGGTALLYPSDPAASGEDFLGTPVFVDGKLAGIVVNESPDHLTAIPIDELLKYQGTDHPLRWQDRLDNDLRYTLNSAEQLRRRLEGNKVHMEHLLLALFRPGGPLPALVEQSKIGMTRFLTTMERFFKRPLQSLPSTLDQDAPLNLDYSKHAEEALQLAVQIANPDLANNRHLMVAIFSNESCEPVRALLEIGFRELPDIQKTREDEQKIQNAPAQRPKRKLKDPGPNNPGQSFLGHLDSDGTKGTDFLHLETEVGALCSVLASKEVAPPISVGLFGSWGTGKSFFMEKMVDEIDRLKVRALNEKTPWCSHIVQIRFNAWHYTDTNLWASMTSKLFEDLAVAVSEKDLNTSERAKEMLLAATGGARDVLAEAEKKKTQAQENFKTQEESARRLTEQAAAVEEKLDPVDILRVAFNTAVEADPEIKTKLSEAATALGFDAVEAVSSEVQAELLKMKGTAAKAKAETAAYWAPGNRYKLILAALLVFLIPLAVAWITAQLKATSLSSVLSAVVGLAGSFIGAVRFFRIKADGILKHFETIRAAQERPIKEKAAALETALKADRDRVKTELGKAETGVQTARAELERLDQQLQALRNDRQKVVDWVKDRGHSNDYTQHLGLISKARGDFETLSRLMKKAREEEKAAKDALKVDLPRIERIIHYIDDLDRCDETRVVDVLQAVHLLLAFDLFIVVVGVDPRWLLHSLKRRSVALKDAPEVEGVVQADDLDALKSTPMDYLEKIFQIPFALRPMGHEGFKSLMSGWESEAKQRRSAAVQPAAVPVEAPPPAAPPPASPPGTAAGSPAPVLGTAEKPPPPPPSARPKDPPPKPPVPIPLPMEPHEWEALRSVGSLIGSPRAAKRLLNVYRLMRASMSEAAQRDFVTEGTGEYRAALLLLALTTSHPEAAAELQTQILAGLEHTDWRNLVRNYCAEQAKKAKATSAKAAWTQMEQRVRSIAVEFGLTGSCDELKSWIPVVARYSFYPTAAAEGTVSEEAPASSQLAAKA